MNYTKIIKDELRKNYRNKIIYASEVYNKVFSKKYISIASFYQTIERMYKNKELKKLSKGVYYYNKENDFGEIPVSNDEIFNRYTSNNKGMIIGYRLYTDLKLTTQVSKKISIYTSSLKGQTKNIRNIELKRVGLKFTNEIVKNIQILEVLENFETIEDLNLYSFYNYAKEYVDSYNEIALKKVLEVMKYKKSTISFLRNILVYFNAKHSIDNYLSSFSKYKHKTMKEIYEFIQ